MDLLKDLTPQDIDLLLIDLDLRKQGYIINYIIDASDIISYSFPYGLKFDMLKKDIDIIGDEIISYEYIFSNYKPILLNEYKYELLLNRNDLKTSNEVRLNNKSLRSFMLKGNQRKFNALINSATYLLAVALKQKNMIDDFDNTYNQKIQVESLTLSNKDDEIIIENLFKSIKRTEWCVDTFKKWRKIQNNEDFNNRKHIKNQKSTFRDLVAIDRICTINNKIQENDKLKNKYIFYYFSGAKKSEELFNLQETIKHLPTIGKHTNFNIFRSLKHSFIMFLINDQDINEIIERLTELKTIALKKNENEEKNTSQINKDFFEQLNLRRRDALEKGFIGKQIRDNTKFQLDIEKTISQLKKENDKFEIYKLYEKLLKDAKIANADIELLNMKASYLLEGEIINLLNQFSKIKEYKIYKGDDLIKGSYHHLPLLLFFDYDSCTYNDKVEDIYRSIIDHLIMNPTLDQGKFEYFINNIKDVLKEIESNFDYEESYYELLFKVFFILLLVKSSELDDEISEIIEDSYEELKLNEEYVNKWGDDYLYILVWYNRRINNFKKANEFCDKALKLYPEDSRFYHGKALILYNQYFVKDSLDSCNLKDLKQILSFSETAINKYQDFIESDSACREEYESYVKGSISSLQNLILYSISIYYLDKLEDDLTNFEKNIISKYSLTYLRDSLLKAIKEFEDNSKHPSKAWPEYTHTESVFELVEALQYNSKEKFHRSEDAIEKALSKNPKTNLYRITEVKIKEIGLKNNWLQQSTVVKNK